MEREVSNAYSSGSDLSAAKRYLFFSGLWTAGYPLLFTCEQLERNLHDIVIVAGINELKSCFRALLSECFIINSVSVARWTKASIWHEKKAQIFVRGYNLLRCEQLFRGGVLSLPLRWIVVRYFLVFSLVSKYRNVSKSFRLIDKKLYNHSQHLISCQKLFGWVRAPLLGKYRCIIFSRSLQHDFSCTISETFWDSGLIYDFIKSLCE